MTDPRIAVVGGGVAGLAAAHRLVEISREVRCPLDLTLFEAGARLGGTIATEITDGFVIESGPDSFISEKPSALDLCTRLGISERLVGTREEFGRTYVIHRGRLCPLPDGFLLMAPTQLGPLVASPLFTWSGKLRMAADLILPRGPLTRDTSLGEFVTRRLGREALERVAQPLVGGIYTADPDQLSLAATMPRFLDMEREHRSIIRAMWRQRRASVRQPTSGARWSLFLSFDKGMQVLVDALAQRLPEGIVRLRSPVESVRPAADGTWLVNGSNSYDAIILAGPAWSGADLLAAADAPLAAELAGIGYASSATVTLAYRRDDIPHPLNGFGFVVPFAENRGILACTFSSIKYPGRAPAEFVLLRAFVGGALQPERFEDDEAAMEANVRREYLDLLGIVAEPVVKRIARYARAMPQYRVGHLDRLARIEQRLSALPGLAVAGSAYRGVGIPDCVRSGEEAAAAIADHVQRHGRRSRL